MLVLTRKAQETIVIADEITVTVLRIKGGRIQIGIDAPSSVQIRRRELPPRAGGALASPAEPGAAPAAVQS